MNDPYHMAIRMCDDTGLVSNEVIDGMPNFTWLNRHAALSNTPYTSTPFRCTGHAHFNGLHIRCTSPAHEVMTSVAGLPLPLPWRSVAADPPPVEIEVVGWYEQTTEWGVPIKDGGMLMVVHRRADAPNRWVKNTGSGWQDTGAPTWWADIPARKKA